MAEDGFKIVRLHTEKAQEYRSINKESKTGAHDDIMSHFLQQSFPPPYTPEHNPVAERVNRTIVEPVRTMLIQANLPTCLWPCAVANVVHVRNRLPHFTTKTTPHQRLT